MILAVKEYKKGLIKLTVYHDIGRLIKVQGVALYHPEGVIEFCFCIFGVVQYGIIRSWHLNKQVCRGVEK